MTGKSGTPAVSMMVAAYNAEAYLGACLDSLSAQTMRDIEIIVADDGSTDGTAGICERAAAKDSRIRVLRSEENCGINTVRQLVLEAARGKYVAVLDADDLSVPGRLQRQFEYLEEHPETVLLGSYYTVIDPAGHKQGTRMMPHDPAELHWVLTFGNCLGHSTTMYRREPALACGGYNAATRYGGDMEFYARLIGYGNAGVLREELSSWRRHPANWTRSAGKRDDFIMLVQRSLQRLLGRPISSGAAGALFNNGPAAAASAAIFHESLEIVTDAFLALRNRFARNPLGNAGNALEHAAYVQLASLRKKNCCEHWWTAEKGRWLDTLARVTGVYGSLPLSGYTRIRPAVPTLKMKDRIRMLPSVIRARSRAAVLRKQGDDRQEYALSRFLKATVQLYAGTFKAADATMGLYRSMVDYDRFERNDNRSGSVPSLSVVVVAFRTGQLLMECLEGLLRQRNTDFEIIVIDNGGNESVAEQLRAMPLLHVMAPFNLILSEGRNIGVHYARAATVAFLDDDALVPDTYTGSILEAFGTYGIKGMRGKVLPKTDSPNNKGIGHYDLGDLALPSNVDTEGNSAFNRTAYLETGGMNPLLFGHEGFELSFRLAHRYGERCTIYWPGTIIYHDYAVTDSKLGVKQRRTKMMTKYVRWRNPGIKVYRKRMKQIVKNEETRRQGHGALEPLKRGRLSE